MSDSPESEIRSPDKNVTSLYKALRFRGNQLLQSTKRSLTIGKQSAEPKFADRAASRKSRQRARELAKLRSALLVSPSVQEEQARLKAEEERKRGAEEARRHAEAAGIKAQQERQLAEQAQLEAEEERKRSAEEARRHAEAEAGIKAEQERQLAEQAQLEAEEESRWDSENKHCPKCKRVVRSDQAYCLYDATLLVSADVAPSVLPVLKLNATRSPVVWIFIITLLGTGILGFMVVNLIRNLPSAQSEEIVQSVNAKQDQPVVGGPLNGKETILPNPEYPEKAKSEGASGKVTVAVLVDNKGMVISARALNGHPLLQVPAVAAARKAKFALGNLISQRPRTSGTITYNFKQ
jgi:TonB family protein